MSDRAHDPLADPLTPYWRAKVERAVNPYWQPARQTVQRPLTELQRQTLALLALGWNGAEIGRWRGVGRASVYSARDGGLQKLQRSPR